MRERGQGIVKGFRCAPQLLRMHGMRPALAAPGRALLSVHCQEASAGAASWPTWAFSVHETGPACVSQFLGEASPSRIFQREGHFSVCKL